MDWQISLRVWRHKSARLIDAAVRQDNLLATAIVVFLGWLLVSSTGAATQQVPRMNNSLLFWLVALGLLFVVVQTRKRYQAITYHSKIVLDLVETWEEKLDKQRTIAAKCCLEFFKPQNGDWSNIKKQHPNARMLEDILNVFDDLGFYLYFNQISDELVHHYFGHFVLLYWLAGSDAYVADYRARQPAAYRYVEELFKRVRRVEAALTRSDARGAEDNFRKHIEEYLRDEFESGDEIEIG